MQGYTIVLNQIFFCCSLDVFTGNSKVTVNFIVDEIGVTEKHIIGCKAFCYTGHTTVAGDVFCLNLIA